MHRKRILWIAGFTSLVLAAACTYCSVSFPKLCNSRRGPPEAQQWFVSRAEAWPVR